MLRRVRTDVDLFYVMDHTEALARLCVAISEMSGEPLEKFSAAMKLPLFPPSQLSRVEIARARVAELEEQTEMLRRRVGE